MRVAMGLLIAIVVIAALALALIHRRPPDLALERRSPLPAGVDITSVQAFIAGEEDKAGSIRKGLAKQIVWADPLHPGRTALSVVYVHGFSASPAELRPLPDRVAAALGANLFFTRLAGHGLEDPDALGRPVLGDWTADLEEALAIGRLLGDRVVVIATSTGASLVTWALARPGLSETVAATVLLSPNYGIQASGSFLLTGPFAKEIAHLVIGARRGFEPVNALNAHNWTTDYPVEALIPMAEAVRLAAFTPVEDIKVPAFFVYSPRDLVVRPDLTAAIAIRWGAPHESFDPGTTGDANNHVIAGDTYSPATTEPIAKAIVNWLGRQGIR
ncbi:alpha/beta hydrolase [Rhizobium wuzhouense]|uniref:Alpha/beta hydrolase n=1 Tax=Rhizobium wuzhouense TaxID=1986026 RepID=A0ABX5NPY3_9HYPH|nr:alpha/beta hydrolase [Rhizobium wuzhouense]PYB71421.1 alpha/beta hydrolase [Rhizobium wuzhouense]